VRGPLREIEEGLSHAQGLHARQARHVLRRLTTRRRSTQVGTALEGKLVIVAGTSRGIGLATAHDLHERGARLSPQCARSPISVQSLQTAIGSSLAS
jgi:hypothetical protein